MYILVVVVVVPLMSIYVKTLVSTNMFCIAKIHEKYLRAFTYYISGYVKNLSEKPNTARKIKNLCYPDM